MSRRQSQTNGRRMLRVGEAGQALAVLRAEMRDKTARFVERYHLLHVWAHDIRLEWLELPWYRRAWLRLSRQKLDWREERAKALAAWDAKHTRKKCGVSREGGPETCEHDEGHDGPHAAMRAAQVEGLHPVVEWTTETEEP